MKMKTTSMAKCLANKNVFHSIENETSSIKTLTTFISRELTFVLFGVLDLCKKN